MKVSISKKGLTIELSQEAIATLLSGLSVVIAYLVQVYR